MFMKRLSKPNINLSDVYSSCIGGLVDQNSILRLTSATDSINRLSIAYDIHARIHELYKLPHSRWGNEDDLVFDQVTKRDMTNLYSLSFAKAGKPARNYYDEIMLSAPLGKCPYCGFGHVSTLDHFLSKARYPAFSVLPINLIPSCSDCNHGKASSLVTQENQISHPYYELEHIENDSWLFASVSMTSPVTVEFYAEFPESWPPDLVSRVENYFRDFKLASRFAVESASELVSLSDYLNILAEKNMVGIYLRGVADAERARERNTWKAALYDALAISPWYAEGGWRI